MLQVLAGTPYCRLRISQTHEANDYVKELGYDAMFPHEPCQVSGGGGANGAAYCADYCQEESGDRTHLWAWINLLAQLCRPMFDWLACCPWHSNVSIGKFSAFLSPFKGG